MVYNNTQEKRKVILFFKKYRNSKRHAEILGRRNKDIHTYIQTGHAQVEHTQTNWFASIHPMLHAGI